MILVMIKKYLEVLWKKQLMWAGGMIGMGVGSWG